MRPAERRGGDIERKVREDGAGDEDEGLIIPLSVPLIAGPGAIVTTITIAASGAMAASGSSIEGPVAAIAGALVVGAITFASMAWLGGLVARLSHQATALLIRVGGLLLATIGAQMFLGGLKSFFGL